VEALGKPDGRRVPPLCGDLYYRFKRSGRR
jgi:hypothetical protein